MYNVYYISYRQYQCYLNIICGDVSVVQLVASMSGAVLGDVVGLNFSRGEIFTPSIGSFDLLYPSVFIYCVNLHQSLILCSAKAMMFVKYFLTSDIYLISNCILRSIMLSFANEQDQYTTCAILAIINISCTVGSVDVWCRARQCCRGRGFKSR